MDFVDEEEAANAAERRCKGIKDQPPCPREREGISERCGPCDREHRILTLIDRYSPVTDEDAEKKQKAKDKAAETKKRRQAVAVNGGVPPPAAAPAPAPPTETVVQVSQDPAAPPTVSLPAEATPPVAITKPDPVKKKSVQRRKPVIARQSPPPSRPAVLRPDPEARIFKRCGVPGCLSPAIDIGICERCALRFKMWRTYATEDKPCPMKLEEATIKVFETLASRGVVFNPART